MWGAVALAVLMMASAASQPAELPDDYIPFTFGLSDSGLLGSSEHLHQLVR